MASPRFQRARAFKFATRTAGQVGTTTTWTAFDTGTDLVLEAQVGDVLEAGVVGVWDSGATYGRLDCVTIVSAAVVNSFSGTYGTTSNGVGAWLGPTGTYESIGASIMRAVVAGDLASGLVTCRLMIRGDATGKSLLATATDPFQFWVKNLGPSQPF